MATLEGLTIGVTGARKGAELAETLRRRGARPVLGPTLAGDVPVPDDELAAMVDRVVAHPPAVFAASTGAGMRLLADVAAARDRTGPLRDALAAARVLARGAKARGGLQRLQVVPDWTAPDELDRQVADELRRLARPDDRVVVQAHGAGGRVYDRLADDGLAVEVVRPYVSAPLEDPAPARALVDDAVAARLDAVVFTSPGAVHGMADVGRDRGCEAQLRAALGPDGPVAVVAVGPVTGAAVTEEGWSVRVQPTEHRTGAMVRALEAWVAGGAD